ncbi:alpha/beta hydrolase [Candidatus Poribacteria bacterium]|nr:alpha/beta hydrolase [Candidatus Poribacteria bacterium]
MDKKSEVSVETDLIQISLDSVTLEGSLNIPEGAQGLVLFAHGSGSSRKSPRNRFVAEELGKGNLGTLLFDLLTSDEESIDIMTREIRFDIDLLSERLIGATKWVMDQPATQELKIGYFGSSTGAAAALIGAANLPDVISAVVSRGGRPDMAEGFLNKVKAPTLLIVGGNDYHVIKLNEQAIDRLSSEKKMEIVPGATHLFEEPGKLEQVAQLARHWFQTYLTEHK